MSGHPDAGGARIQSAPMDLALLRTFVTVAQTGSVNLAAGELHLSQASVSRHVQRLESTIGTELFTRRDGRALELTDAGRRILEPCVRLLGDAERQWARLRMLALEAGRRLVVGLGPAVAFLPEAGAVLRRFRELHPQLDLQLVEHRNYAAALRDVLAGEIDIAVTGLRDADVGAEIEAVPIVDIALHAVVPAGHRLAGRAQVAIADLARESFAFMDGGDAHAAFVDLCAAAGVVPRIAHRCEQTMTLVQLLGDGDAITVAYAGSGAAPGFLADRFELIPLALDRPGPRTTMSVFWNAARPPTTVAADFVAMAREAATRAAA